MFLMVTSPTAYIYKPGNFTKKELSICFYKIPKCCTTDSDFGDDGPFNIAPPCYLKKYVKASETGLCNQDSKEKS